MNRFLYRGVNLEFHRKANGMLRPRSIGVPFKRPVYYGTKVFYGSGVTYGESEANAVIMHQRDSSEYLTSGISTTELFENAIRYATHDGKYSAGIVYKIDVELFEEYGVKCYAVDEYAVRPAIPEDKEVILVAKDFGHLPKEIVVEVINVQWPCDAIATPYSQQITQGESE